MDRHSDHAGFPCIFLGRPPECPAGPGPDTGLVQVGFRNTHKGGLCWAWVSCQHRGFVRFDLTAIQGKQVLAAALRYDITAHSTNSPEAFPNSCALSLGTPKDASRTTGTPVDLVKGDLPDGKTNNLVPVTELVRAWARGERPNHGFAIDGQTDPPRNNDNHCLTDLGNFRLQLDVAR